MILGIGTDIVKVERIKDIMDRTPKFLNRICDNNEVEYLQGRNLRAEFVAGRFAAKEAVAKALGTGFREFSFKDIVVEYTTLGKPIVVLKGKAKLLAKKNGNYKVHLSISHEKDIAIAYAVIEVRNGEDSK